MMTYIVKILFITRNHLVKKCSLVSNAPISTSFSNFVPLKMKLTVSKKQTIFDLANEHFKTFCVGQ